MSTGNASELEREARIRGCLLGGAVGDALGAPVEFLSLAEIRAAFGPQGIREFAPAYGRLGAITDDTQMTLFTAEGVIRAAVRFDAKGICHPPGVIHRALLRWLLTQGERNGSLDEPADGWLIQQRDLLARRAPGNTCLSALRTTPLGEPAQNDSKGCGAIMRIAPIGLVTPAERVYALAAESAQSTHGHRESTLSSGFFALVVSELVRGAGLDAAIDAGVAVLKRQAEPDVVLGAIARARALAASSGALTPELLETLGGGWVAEEALAIALCCALGAASFEDGLRLAANHSGDSDSTASLTGQLLGTLHGDSAIPPPWLDQLELRDVIEQVARDLSRLGGSVEELWDRYPGW